MRKASRLFEIIQILRLATRPVTAARIAETLEVTVRSIYRDIAALQAMRVPIEGGRGIGYILRPGFDLPPLMFTIEETEAIVLALALLERTGDAELKTAARRVNAKIAGAMPEPLRQALTGNVLHAWGTIAPTPTGVDLAMVRRAIRDEQKLFDRLPRCLWPGNRAQRPAAGADLLFGDRRHCRLVRTADRHPQFPGRPRGKLRAAECLFPWRRRRSARSVDQGVECHGAVCLTAK